MCVSHGVRPFCRSVFVPSPEHEAKLCRNPGQTLTPYRISSSLRAAVLSLTVLAELATF